MSDLDNIIAKIQKLINLQEGAEAVGSYAEAENAAARVQDILMKYNLDLETVKGSTIRTRAEFFDGWIGLKDKAGKSESFWVPKLYTAIGNNNLCRVTTYTDGIMILGRKEQVDLVLYISEQMISKIRIAEKFAWKEYIGEEKRGTFRRGFFDGATVGINSRLSKDMQPDSNPYAVMIISRKTELDNYSMYGTIDPNEIELIKKQRQQEYQDFLEEQKKQKEMLSKLSPEELRAWKKAHKEPKTKYRYSKGPKGLSSNDGYTVGKAAGEKMSINKGMNNSHAKANIS